MQLEGENVWEELLGGVLGAVIYSCIACSKMFKRLAVLLCGVVCGYSPLNGEVVVIVVHCGGIR